MRAESFFYLVSNFSTGEPGFLADDLLAGYGLPQSRFLRAFCVTGVVIALIAYVVMPRYTRLVRDWLHRRELREANPAGVFK